MTSFATIRTPHLVHHVAQGSEWLAQADRGVNTVALSYAAFEFRLAIERLGVLYWAQLLDRPLEEQEIRSSFKRAEQAIYRLAGHQKEIEGPFAFIRVVFRALKIDREIVTPRLGQLSKYWHQCSELCHIGWSFNSADSVL